MPVADLDPAPHLSYFIRCWLVPFHDRGERYRSAYGCGTLGDSGRGVEEIRAGETTKLINPAARNWAPSPQ